MSVTVHSAWVCIAETSDGLFEHSDQLMEALLDQECNPNFFDSAVSTDVGNSTIEIEAEATGRDLAEAISTVQACFRAALHQVGFGTPGWPSDEKVMSMLVKDIRTEQLA